MNKKLKFSALGLLFLGVLCITVFALTPISRVTRGIMNQGGTTTLNGNTVVISDSPTNEFQMVLITATVAGAATASTNNFTTPFIVAPNIIPLEKSGVLNGTFRAGTTPTVTTTNFIVSGMNSAGSTNNIPYILYGYTRTGTFE